MVSRPRSPPGSPLPSTKRRKTISEPVDGIVGNFHSGLLDESSVVSLNAQYAASQPYKHAVIPKIFSDELLRNVKDEILENVSFTEKETDIYKVGHFYANSGTVFHNGLVGSPNGRPCVAFVLDTRTAGVVSFAAEAPRSTLLTRVSKLFAWGYGMRPSVGEETGHVCQFVQKR
jgi:hypothetical protein